MKIKFVGTGGAFDYYYRNSAAIVSINNKNILVDAGNSIYFTLREKLALEGIDGILITHFHDDHVGSLASIVLHHKHFFNKMDRMPLYYPDENFKNQLIRFLSFSLQSPEEYINFKPISDLTGVSYLDTFGKHVEGMQTYSYFFEEGEDTIAYSGDLGDADILFEEIKRRKMNKPTVFHEIFFSEIPSHAYYKALEKHLDEFKIFGYHCNASAVPPDCKIPLVVNQPEFLL